jgi:hypothetical protein
MKRRKFILGAGSLAAGSAAAVGTGAFSSASVDNRSFEGTIVNDNSALLRLNPTVSPYATQDGNGYLSVEIDGLNQESTFTFMQLFRIHNDGTQTVDVSISDVSGSGVGSAVQAVPGDKVNSGTSVNDLQSNSITLGPGEALDVGVELQIGANEAGNTYTGTFDVEAN